MTLAKRMTLSNIGLLTALVVLATSAAWGLFSARQSVRIARDEYLELRMLLTLNEHLMAAKGGMDAGGIPKTADVELAAAMLEWQALVDFQSTQHKDIEPHEEHEGGYLRALHAELRSAALLLAAPSDELDVAGILVGLNAAEAQLKHLMSEMDDTIASAQRESNRTLQATLVVLALVSCAMIVATVLVNIAQYRSVVMPIRRLRDGVGKIASGQFDQRLQSTDDDEFAQLSRDFNRMAGELEELYRDLEHRVREKSRELVRSERLASVGYLAAGVAHEISNPLNIISGYAELSLRRTRKHTDAPDPEYVARALSIIRDESFRCKEIIEKLLSLSAGGEAERRRVALDQVVDDIATMLGSLKQYRGRKVSVRFDQPSELAVLGNETELRQVVLNLAVNALEAVEPDVGEVLFEGRRHNGVVELVITDNGCGMTPDAREHVFEPFFTQRTESQKRGLGLGLSITHAIVESHGGRITAHSDGLNQGSRFVVELPACAEKVTVT